ncbi:MAG: hypothetical protein WA126_11840 [Thermodesulfovibrionales bacterium]
MKKIIIVMVAISFCLIMAGIAGAAEAVKPGGTTTQQLPPGTQQPVPVFTCPAGWKKVTNELICVPKKPSTPLNCPKGYTYAEYLSCAPGQPGGGCQIGCYQTLY